MADSDGEYIDDLSDDETNAHQVTRGVGAGTRSSGRGGAAQAAQPKARWEDIQRSWDTVVEGADGSISSTVVGLLEAGKRKRLLRDTTPLQRGIIRHLIIVLDLSSAMAEKDLRPTRYLLTIRYAQEFVTEFFEQNPISQLGIIGMRDGLAVRISDMSGNPNDHIGAIQALRTQDPKGHPSLQNALDMTRAALFNAPSHGTREVTIVFGALLSSDPGDIHKTITALVGDKIRVGVVGLAAQVAICRELVMKTNEGNDSAYGVALNEQHFRELLLESTTPPVTRSAKQSASSLLMMGFPSRIVETHASLCACHSKLTKGGYLCSRCTSKVCSLPSECPACGLTLILSTHLARSYHHLFPLLNWVEVPWRKAGRSSHCFACQTPFPTVPTEQLRAVKEAAAKSTSGTSPSSRYECTVCGNHFCIDCDVWSHEVVHNCPGCQSAAAQVPESNGEAEAVDGEPGAVQVGNGTERMDFG
ncbi:MAG: transcription initiation factor TFIIH subunit [Piccolia ochrophora]|nr:MAG: transcription initiation factor TFIIH subunit [Piccolia ochrophora]